MRCLVLLVILATASALGDGRSIALEANLHPRDAPLGDALSLRVAVKNVSGEPILLLLRDTNFVVEVQSERETQTITSPRYTRRATAFKDDEVPLRPEDSYSRTLPIPLNDLRSTLGEGWVAEPGMYHIRVRYDSDRSLHESSNAIWRGTQVSAWMDIHLRPPDHHERMKRLNELRNCVRSEACNAVEVSNFYRVVRDEHASDLLLGLIEKKPYSIWVLDAIVFQAHSSDAKRLREFALRVDDPSTRQLFIDAASKLDEAARSPAKK